MPEIAKTRRRWLLGLLAAALLFVGGPIAWQLRPLTPAERVLVGHWHSSGYGVDYYLSANRHFEVTTTVLPPGSPPVRGTWTASESSFQVRSRPYGSAWTNPIRHWYARLTARTESSPLRFEGPDRCWVQDVELVRVRD